MRKSKIGDYRTRVNRKYRWLSHTCKSKIGDNRTRVNRR